MTAEQVDIVRKHLALVFVHEIDPSYPAEQQAKLNEVHGEPPKKPPHHSLSDPHPFDGGSGRLPGGVYRC